MVVFDLDETLVHCIFRDEVNDEADVFIDITMINGKTTNTGFNIRPYWKELMDEIKKDWEIVVFTASCQAYADAILDHMDPDNEYFQHRLYRETCWKTEEGVYIKDLRVFEGWDLEDIILVDNAVYSFGFQLDNGIPIFPYYRGKDDKQLLYLKEYLAYLHKEHTIRDLRKIFQMKNLQSLDIDNLNKIYLEDEEEEKDCPIDNLLDIMCLDKEFYNRANRAPSFENGKFLYPKNRNSITETCTQGTKEMGSKDSQGSSPEASNDYFFRANSNNDDMLHPNLIDSIDPIDIDEEMDEQFNISLNPTGKPKQKRKARLTMKKTVSVVYPKGKKLAQTSESPQPLEDGSSNAGSNKNAQTPTLPAKKRPRKKKLKHYKGSKLASSIVEKSRKLCDDEPKEKKCKEISLFQNYSNNSERDNSQEDSPPKNPQLSAFARGESYSFKRVGEFSKSEKFHKKRNSSPLDVYGKSELLKTSAKGVPKRMSSTSSGSSNLERDDENGGSTASTSIVPFVSSFTSSDTTPNDHSKKINVSVAPFESAIQEANKEEEVSPDRRHLEIRRDSLADDLDGIQEFFGHVNGQGKRHSNAHPGNRPRLSTKVKRKSKHKKD